MGTIALSALIMIMLAALGAIIALLMRIIAAIGQLGAILDELKQIGSDHEDRLTGLEKGLTPSVDGKPATVQAR
jgi:hypothetical protein